MTVEELEQRMSSLEQTEWRAVFEIEGDELARIRAEARQP